MCNRTQQLRRKQPRCAPPSPTCQGHSPLGHSVPPTIRPRASTSCSLFSPCSTGIIPHAIDSGTIRSSTTVIFNMNQQAENKYVPNVPSCSQRDVHRATAGTTARCKRVKLMNVSPISPNLTYLNCFIDLARRKLFWPEFCCIYHQKKTKQTD